MPKTYEQIKAEVYVSIDNEKPSEIVPALVECLINTIRTLNDEGKLFALELVGDELKKGVLGIS